MQRVGLIGSGFMATTHANSYQQIPNVKIVAVASLDDNRDEFVAIHAPEAEIYADAETMFDEADLTMVDLCTPTPTHRPLIESAVDRGLDVFCEKPMARTIEGANAVVDTVSNSDITFMTGHVLRYFPEYRTAKRRIDAGEIGTPGTLRAERLSSPPKHATDNWFSDREQSGGVLLDMAIHDFDFLRWVAGDVDRVFTQVTDWYEDGHMKEHAAVNIRFKNGTIGYVEASWAYPEGSPFVTAYEFSGDAGMLKFDSRDDHSLRVSGGTADEHIPRTSLENDPYTRELQHFVECAETNADPEITPEDAREAVRIALAAIESGESGEPVQVAEVDA